MKCATCGKEYEGSYCPKGCPPPGFYDQKKKKRKTTWWYSLIFVFVGFVLGFLVGTCNTDQRVPPTGETSLERTYKYSCEFMDPVVLANNPDKYKGKDYIFTGTVTQVLEPKDGWNQTVALHVRVTEGDSTDTIYATVDLPADAKPIVKGDTINLWGTCKGRYTYQTETGETIALPKIDVVYYDLGK